MDPTRHARECSPGTPLRKGETRPISPISTERIQGKMGEPLESFSEPGPQPHFVTPMGSRTPSVWAQRLLTIVEVVVCVWAGMLLAVLPWTPVWNGNPLLLKLPWLGGFLTNNFIRGALTGVGLVDIWIGIWDAVHYRDVPAKS